MTARARDKESFCDCDIRLNIEKFWSLGHYHHHHPEKILTSYFYIYLSRHFVKSAEMSDSVTAAQHYSHNPALL